MNNSKSGPAGNDHNPVGPNYQDLFVNLPIEVRKQIDDAIGDASPDESEEILYEILAAHRGSLGKDELLAIDLEEYDQLRTYPDDGTDWPLWRYLIMFLQAAVRAGIPWSQVATKTLPHFPAILKPPFEPVCEQLEPSPFQLPMYDTARHTPASWAREAEDASHQYIAELVNQIQGVFDHHVASGKLKLFMRSRLSKNATNKEPIIGEWLAMEMAAKRFLLGMQWVELAEEFPPSSGYHCSPPARAKKKKKRANQIKMRVVPLLKHLGLPTPSKSK